MKLLNIYIYIYIYIYEVIHFVHNRKIFKNIKYYFSYKNHFQQHYQTSRKKNDAIYGVIQNQ
jgi:hypothetical protein